MTQHNPILAKKRGSKFYNGAFAGVLLLVTCRNQFSQRKIFLIRERLSWPQSAK